MSFSSLLALLSLLHGSLQSLADTDRSWTKDVSTGILYQISSDSALPWQQARKSCQQQGAELLSITENHEQEYVEELIKNFSSTLWIGLNSLNFNSGWQWAGGSPFRYLNWAPGSPLQAPGKLCGLMNPKKDGKWENQACNQRLGYICEKRNLSLKSDVLPKEELKSITCPDGWWPYTGHCYSIQREPKAWKDALASCKKQGGDLTSVHNVAELSFLVSQLGYKPTEELWLGLNDLKAPFSLEWSDRTPVTFTSWRRGQPSYTKGLERCVVMKGQDGYWATDVCDKELGYSCKKKPSSPSSGRDKIEDPGCQKGWSRYGSHCYLVGSALLTFSEAKKTCEGSKAYLATVESRNEQAFLISLVGLKPEEYFWIGLSATEEGGSFRWSSGGTALFTHWSAAMPGKEQGCVAMRTGPAAGLWDVISCEKTANYLCKQQAAGEQPPAPPVPVPAATCATGWDGASWADSCFKFFVRQRKEMKSWFEAEEFCREIGGSLVTINSREEQALLWQLASDKGLNYQGFWIGLFLLNPDEGFAWVDGSPVVYENWAEDEPNNQGALEHCVMLDGSPQLRWNDLSCDRELNWVCETKKGALLKPEPSYTPVYQTTADGWLLHEDKQYYFSRTKVHMEEAQRICQRNFAALVVIENESKRQFLWKYIYQRGILGSYFIGLVVSFDQKISWLDGTPVNYVAWAPHEPNFANNDENCVIMVEPSGFWQDVSCAVRAAFICERHNSTYSGFAPTVLPALGGCPETWLLFNNKTDCIAITKGSADDAGGWENTDCQHKKSYICQMDSKPELFHSTTAPDSPFIHYGNSSYLIIPSKMNWEEARKACREKSSELASILDVYSNVFLLLQAAQHAEPLWIGLNSNVNYGYQRWSDKRKVTFSRWCYAEPKEKRACVYLGLWGTWRTAPCHQKHFPVCKKSEDVLPSDPPQGTGKCPESGHMFWVPFRSHCYSFNTEELSWEQSVTQCIQAGGTLTSVEDVAESDFLAEHADLYRSKTSGFWIGIYRNMNGQLQWQDNSALEFANWGEGQPVGDLLEHCVELSAASGYWSTLPCHSQKGFICKKAKTILAAATSMEGAKKSQAPRHMNVWIVLTLLLIISLGMGVMVYFLIQVRTQRQTGGEARGSSSTLVEYSYVLTGGDSESAATHKGTNEQSVV